mmetsp:Transcript_58589/g.174431  ORF Transcript_58589/g.174431 Transcript_58589/m.174431 type:complete len:366 (-) Transcript_58589:74-1171(-)
MSPHRSYTDDASSSDGGSTASSGMTRAALHPLQMLQGGSVDSTDFHSTPAAAGPLDRSKSPAASISSDHSSSGGAIAPSAAPSASIRHRHRSSLSSQAFKVHADPARRRVSDGGSPDFPSEHERHLEDLVSSLQKQLDAALKSADEAESRANHHAARASELEEENSRLKSELSTAKEEGREHRALARKVVKDNARLMKEANDREADGQRLSNLAEKVRTLSKRSSDAAVVPGKCDDAAAAGAGLNAVNLANECESLRRENRRLRAEAEEAAKAAAPTARPSLSASWSDLMELPASRQDQRQPHGRGRVSALQRMASIKKMTSILNINDDWPSDAAGTARHRDRSLASPDANGLGVTAAEDFLWDE